MRRERFQRVKGGINDHQTGSSYRATNEFRISISQMENMLDEVKTMDSRLAIQRDILSHRQAKRQSTAEIPSELKDGRAMKTMAVLVMIFLPVISIAVSFPL